MGATGRHVFGAERRQPSHHLLQESHRSGRQVRQVPLATLQPPGTGFGEDQGTTGLQEAAQRPGPRSGKCMVLFYYVSQAFFLDISKKTQAQKNSKLKQNPEKTQAKSRKN